MVSQPPPAPDKITMDLFAPYDHCLMIVRRTRLKRKKETSALAEYDLVEYGLADSCIADGLADFCTG